MDVTDIIQYNLDLLNANDLTASFFHLDPSNPTHGFSYDASSISGYGYPAQSPFAGNTDVEDPENMLQRLRLGSHLAQRLRLLLEEHKGYTSTVGISTNKLLAKLVGNVNKPKGQTTLLPPYLPWREGRSNVHDFIDAHDIGKIPGIGFKVAQKIRRHVLGRSAAHDTGLVYGGTKENVKVKDVRLYPGMGPKLLERVLAGPGVPKDLPSKVWGLINGNDDAEVAKGREVPQQISIEDSYIKLDTMIQVKSELKMLATSLIKRMRLDLTAQPEDEVDLAEQNRLDDEAAVQEDDKEDEAGALVGDDTPASTLRWIAHPRTLRLSTRPRPPLNPDGTRLRTFARISKSGPMPTFIFSLSSSVDALSDKLLSDALLPLFRQLHPEKSGWNLSLVNVCATNMAMTASDAKDGAGRDISRMFKRQDDVLKDWKVEDIDMAPSDDEVEVAAKHNGIEVQSTDSPHTESTSRYHEQISHGSEDLQIPTTQERNLDACDDSEGEDTDVGEVCQICDATVPAFAMIAHRRFHDLPE